MLAACRIESTLSTVSSALSTSLTASGSPNLQRHIAASQQCIPAVHRLEVQACALPH